MKLKSKIVLMVFGLCVFVQNIVQADDLKSEIVYTDNGGQQLEIQKFYALGSNLSFREIWIKRYIGGANTKKCEVGYFGYLVEILESGKIDQEIKVVVTVGGESRMWNLMFIPGQYGNRSYFVGQVECPGSGLWAPKIAFKGPLGHWDSNYGNDFSFLFR